MGACNATKVYTWKVAELRFGIDTGNGVIPWWLNTRSHWGQNYAGDSKRERERSLQRPPNRAGY